MSDAVSTGRGSRLGFIMVALGIFLAALDQTVIVTALPGGMLESLNITSQELDQALWIVTGYLLGYTVAMPLLGRIADVYGLRRVYIISLLLFGAASAGCALSNSLEMLVAWRVIQAIGGGALLPIGMAIAIDQFEGAGAAALGVIGAAAEAGGVLGPAYGGVISSGVIYEGMDWRWIFWVNLPLSALIAAAVYYTLRTRPAERGKVDYVGGALLVGALSALTVALSRSVGSAVGGVDPEQASRYTVSWTAPETLLLLGATLICFVAFLWWERRTPHPLIQLSSFRIPAFSGANATNLLVGAALIIAMVNVPFLENSVRGGDALSGGLMLIRLTVMIPIGAVAGGLLMRRLPGRLVTVIGLLISAAGFWLMGSWQVEVSELRATIDLLLAGLGFGLVIAPLGAAAIGAVGRERMTTAAALLNVMRLVGMTVGIAILASWSLARQNALTIEISQTYNFLTQEAETSAALQQGLLEIYTTGFRAAAVLCLIGLVPALLLPAKPSAERTPLLLG